MIPILKSFKIDGVTWHCLSIFYSRKSSAALLRTVTDFCEAGNDRLRHWSFCFSDIQGECVNLIFTTDGRDSETVIVQAEGHFERFLRENPSEGVRSAPEFLVSRMPYPNNSLVWSAFYIPSFLFDGEYVRNFSQATSSLIASLWDADGSHEENVETIETFLRVQLLKKHNATLPIIPDPVLAQTIRSYWEYEEFEALAEWLRHAEIVSAPVIIRCHLDRWDAGHILEFGTKSNLEYQAS